MGDLEKLEGERGNREYIDTADADDLESTKAAGVTAEIAENVDSRTASDEMCTFLVMNISSLQLIPVNIIAYRSQYGSINRAAVIAPAIVATAVSTGVAVAWCKMMGRSCD